eukprot:jgi/Mesvir1/17904/Mv12972-RA.2
MVAARLFIFALICFAAKLPGTFGRRKSKSPLQRQESSSLEDLGGFPSGWTWETQGRGKCAKFKGDLSLEKAINEGNAYLSKELFVDAADCYLAATKLSPGSPVAYTNLGLALTKQGHHKQAHKARGLIMRHMGRHHEGIQSLQISVQKNPRDAEGRANLGLALNHVGRPQEALLQYQAALEIAPHFSEAMVEMGKIHQQGGRTLEAVELYERALAVAPQNGAALVALLHCRTDVCDWKGREASSRAVITHMKKQAAQGVRPNLTPFDALVMTRASAEEMLLLAGAYSARAEAEMAAAGLGPFVHAPAGTQLTAAAPRLRVGYFSSDWGDHPVGRLMVSVPRWHHRRGGGNRKQPGGVDCILYALNSDDGSSYFKQAAKHATSVQAIGHLPHDQMADKIKTDSVHVLVDLMGYTAAHNAMSREYVVARKPAPLVVNMLGYPGTSGSRRVDYVVADKMVLPPSIAHTFAEKVIYMPGSYQVNDPRATVSAKKMSAASVGPLSATAREELLRAEGLPRDKFIFAHFNTLRKVDTEVFDVWMNILRRVPDSVLWLLRMPPAAAPNLANEAASRGVAPTRIIFGSAKSAAQHMQRCVLADLFLDSLTYNAHTTATDALWAGVPIITLPGAMFQARVAASLVSAAGMPELITRSMKEYEDYAVRLATGS